MVYYFSQKRLLAGKKNLLHKSAVLIVAEVPGKKVKLP
jgi:hypothetical protein